VTNKTKGRVIQKLKASVVNDWTGHNGSTICVCTRIRNGTSGNSWHAYTPRPVTSLITTTITTITKMM
jgi:hypothetical protein